MNNLSRQPIKLGFFGGIDEDQAMKDAFRVALIGYRQSKIKQLLHGQIELEVGSADKDSKSIKTVGQYIDHLVNGNVQVEKTV